MKLFVLKLVALIIAVSSLHLSFTTEINFSQAGDDALSSHPLLDVNPIHNPASKSSFILLLPPLSTIQSAIFSLVEKLSVDTFLYYLPIYSLVRAKEYFLLI